MFFTSGIIIAFFCFAFYLIWSQFLKKDTRLSIGLQVLRKKIGDLENLSLTVETQMDRHISSMHEKTRKLECLLQNGKDLCERLEKNIKLARSLEVTDTSLGITDNKKKYSEKPVSKNVVSPDSLVSDSIVEKHLLVEESGTIHISNSPSRSHLKMVEKPVPGKDTQKKHHFGESPFTDMDFIDSP